MSVVSDLTAAAELIESRSALLDQAVNGPAGGDDSEFQLPNGNWIKTLSRLQQEWDAISATIVVNGARTRLTGTTNFYVRTDGNDSNNGLTNNAGGAFLTLQGAFNYLKQYVDFARRKVVVNVADGTYSGGLNLTEGFVGESDVDIVSVVGNIATPGNVVLTNTSNTLRISGSVHVAFSGVRVQSGAIGLEVLNGAHVEISDFEWGDCTEEMALLSGNALLVATGDVTVDGDATSWLHITNHSRATFEGQTITFLGTPVFSTYVVGLNTSSCSFASATLVGDKQGQTLSHIDSTLNLSSTTGKLFGTNSQPRQNAGGSIIYAPPADVLYVRSDGSDYNDGYANTAARAFATIAAAIAWLQTRPYDSSNSRSPIIRVGAGTWTVPIVLVDIPNVDNVNLYGSDLNTPSNTLLSVTSANGISADRLSTCWTIRGFKITTTTSGSGISASRGSNLIIGDMEFGACVGGHIVLSRGAKADVTTSYTISGNAAEHLLLSAGASFSVTTGTITISGTPAFSAAFARLESGSYARVTPTWSNASGATGVRSLVKDNAILDLNGTNQNLLPGASNGTPTNGGIII